MQYSTNVVSPLLKKNFFHLYLDIFWFGVLLGSTLSFLAVYASRIGANSFQVGLLTAGPAVINLLFSIPSGHWLEGRSLIPASFQSSLWHRLPYLAFIFVPLLLNNQSEVWLINLIYLVMSIPGTILAIAFNALFAEAVPPEWRGHVVGRRNALLAISVTATSLLSGQILDRLVFPLNYQVVFLIGALGAILSSYHLYLLKPANQKAARAGKPLLDFGRPGIGGPPEAMRPSERLRSLTRSMGKSLLRLDLLRGPFGAFLAAFTAFYIFQYIPIPLFPLFQVRELQLSDGQISLGAALFYSTMLFISLGLSPITRWLGHRRLMVSTAFIYGFYPLLNAVAYDATLFWVASIVGGGVWALLNGGLINRLMENVPENDRPAHMALHNLALNFAILFGSLLGPFLGDWIGIREALLLSAGLRFLGAFVLAKWG